MTRRDGAASIPACHDQVHAPVESLSPFEASPPHASPRGETPSVPRGDLIDGVVSECDPSDVAERVAARCAGSDLVGGDAVDAAAPERANR
jgi:hypothetical protein